MAIALICVKRSIRGWITNCRCPSCGVFSHPIHPFLRLPNDCCVLLAESVYAVVITNTRGNIVVNWEAISAISESLGTFAVLVTLIYLTVQVKDSKSASADSNRIERAVGIREGLMSLAENDELRNSFDKANGMVSFYEHMASELSISVDDAARTHYYSIYWFWLHWGQYSSTKEKRDLLELENLIRGLYSSPSYFYCWENSPWVKPIIEADFVSFVDELLLDVRS